MITQDELPLGFNGFTDRGLSKIHRVIQGLETGAVRPKKRPKHRVVSLFAGCGGMDLGFKGGFSFLGQQYERNPFRFIWANELNPKACHAYESNLGHKIQCGDIWELLDKMPKSADVLIGGFPCQDISVNNSKGKGVDGKRSGLYRAMVEAVRKANPRIFVAENVKGLLSNKNADSLRRVIRDFSMLGYRVSYELHNAAKYGVPQTRERVVIVGTREDTRPYVAPDPILRNKEEWITAREALYDLEGIPRNEKISHIWSEARKSPEQGSRSLKKDRAGYTIRAECHGNIQWHYTLNRRISMREAARLQSFPDYFFFHAKIRETERMIGNAVPPVLAWHIAKSVEKCLEP